MLTTIFPAFAQISFTTSRYNNQRTSVNSNETTLTPANVNPTNFGKLFSQMVDGYVYAQPLYVSNLTIGGSTHNVVFVATEHDSVYAFDADSNSGSNSQPLWHTSFLSSGVTTVPSSALNSGNTDINPEIGITGTPVIDLSTHTLYVVAETLENNGTSFVKKLHALDITTGAEKPGSPISISASVTLPGQSTVTMDIEGANQRAGLLLYNGVVYVGLGAHGDGTTVIRGWILGYSYNGSAFSQVFVFCTQPSSANGWAAGIWMAGQGLPMDSGSNLFVATGNGQFDTNLNPPVNYGDSIIRIDLSKGPTVQDYFTPSDQATLAANDQDVGSGGIAILPDQTGTNPHLLIQAGKEGTVYVVNRDNMGHYNSSHDNIVQEIVFATQAIFGSPAFFNNKVYFWGMSDFLKAFTLTNGTLSTSPSDTGPDTVGFPGATPTISANGASNSILWALREDAYSDTGPGGPAVLYAYDANNLSQGAIYKSSQNSTRDNPGGAIKFAVPTVANGKVYVGAEGQLSVYGELAGGTPAAITSVPSTTFTVGFAGTFTVIATGSPTPSLTETGTLPSGVTFMANGSGTASLSGTPASGTAGTYTLTIKAHNGVGSDASQTFTLTVNPAQAPAITSANNTTFTVGSAGDFTMTATGSPTPLLSETGTLPSGVTFVDNGNGIATLSGTPASGTAGTYTLTLKAHNGVGTDASQTFTLTVSGSGGGGSPNFAYVTGSTTGVYNGGKGSSTTLAVTLHQNPGAGHLLVCAAVWQSSTATASVSDPNNGTWTVIGGAVRGVGALTGYSGQMFYIPAAVSASTTVTLTTTTATVFRSLECAEYSYSGTLSMDGTPQYSTTPASGGVATISGLRTSNSGDLVLAACIAVDTHCSGGTGYTLRDDPNSLNVANGTSNKSFLGATGQAIEDNVGAAAGAQTATFGTLTNTDNVILGLLATTATGSGTAAPAITSANSTTFTVGIAGTFIVTSTGSPTPSLAETGTLPTGVTFVDNGNGTATLSGTPAVGTVGTYAFTIKAHNGVVTTDASQNFTLTVNQAPAITSASNTTFTVGTAGNFTATSTGSPTPSLTETGTLPAGVTFVDNGNGTATLSGTPAAGTGGTYALTIKAHNGVGTDASQNFTLTVNQPSAITSANSTTFTVGTAGSFTVTTSGWPKPSLSETGTLPTGLTFVDNGNGTATLSGTPAAGTGGTYALTIKAHNGVGTDASQTFTLTVSSSGGGGSPNFAYVTGSTTGVYNGGSSSSTTLAVKLHQNPGAGHLLVCAAVWQSSTATASVSDPNNGTWTAIGGAVRGVGALTGYSGQMFYIPAAISAATTVTLTTTTATVFRSLECAEYSYSGTLSTDGTPQYSTTPSSGGVATIGGLTTSNSGDLVLAACIAVDTACMGGAGYTLRDDPNSLNVANGTTNNSFISATGQTIEDRVGVAAGAQTATFGTATNSDNVILGLLGMH